MPNSIGRNVSFCSSYINRSKCKFQLQKYKERLILHKENWLKNKLPGSMAVVSFEHILHPFQHLPENIHMIQLTEFTLQTAIVNMTIIIKLNERYKYTHMHSDIVKLANQLRGQARVIWYVPINFSISRGRYL